MLYNVPMVNSELYATVDSDDFHRVSRYSWYVLLRKRGAYARATIDGELVRLHRFIVDARAGEVVDHINSDGMDNRKANLRICSHSQNMQNQRKQDRKTTSQYKGVCKYQYASYPPKWRADIKLNRKTKYLGLFATEESAAMAYNAAASESYGEFALLNKFPATG